MVVVERPTLRTADWEWGPVPMEHGEPHVFTWQGVISNLRANLQLGQGKESRIHLVLGCLGTKLTHSVQSLSHVQLFATPWTAARQVSLSITNSQSLLKVMSIESVMPSNHLILCHPLLLLPSIFLSIRVFSNESALHVRWPKYWNFGFSISPSNEHSGVISSRINWFDLLAAQELFTLIDPYYFSSLSLTKIKIMISQKWTSRVSLMKGNPWGQWTVLWC